MTPEDVAAVGDSIIGFMYGANLAHPAIAFTAGGGVCPVQHRGWLTNGLHFYFRYRGAYASVRLGTDPDSAIDGTHGRASMPWGTWPDGFFPTEGERNWVFATLLREALTNQEERS